ncbi:MAG: alpha/beta hydrolase, partial [Candidatus Sabulitectum sp.]|nr:alpha/beta hydrolase [Candidatus Sabulitectum sp.]
MPGLMTNGVNLYFEVRGEGQPLLMIAGLASDSQSWLPVVDELSDHRKLIIPDNRGAGRTNPLNAETSIEKIADDCISLIDYLELPSADILGHSMGGFVALDLAIRYPHRVSRLILESTSAFCSPRNNKLFSDWSRYLQDGMTSELWFRNVFYWIFSEKLFADERLLQSTVESAVQYPYQQTAEAFNNQVTAIGEFNCLEDLKKITCETLAVFGGDDLLFQPDENSRVLTGIPGVVVSIVVLCQVLSVGIMRRYSEFHTNVGTHSVADS